MNYKHLKIKTKILGKLQTGKKSAVKILNTANSGLPSQITRVFKLMLFKNLKKNVKMRIIEVN